MNSLAVKYSKEECKELEYLSNQCNLAIKRIIAAQQEPSESSRMLFRVVVLPNEQTENLTIGQIYQPYQLFSTSSNLTLSLHDGINKKAPENHKSVLFVIEESAHLAANIHLALNNYGSDESIFPIETQFKVLKTCQNGDFYQVHLRAI